MPGKSRYIGRYIIEDRTLGKGNFAVVELATHNITKSKVAVKVIDKSKIREEYVRDNLYREARILAQLRHPNVVRLYETISSSSLYCLVTEYAGGGDLLSFVRGQRDGRLTEVAARPFVRQLVSALHHLHERGVVHRDLKMENIMLDDKRKHVKIVDFGLSNTFSTDCLLKTHCGSPEYAAPELFISDKEYGPEVDIWSLGVNMFAMVTGRLPFSTPYSENRRERLMQQIQNGLGMIHGREMAHLTQECEELLSQLIEPSPELRLPLLDIEIHPWLTRQGQYPFSPYQQPQKDMDMKKMTIDKMACLLNVSSDKIEATVHEYRLDDISAIYNLMMDQDKLTKGFWDIDHTMMREIKRPKVIEADVQSKVSPVQREQQNPEEEHIELKTPTVIGMVRPSWRNVERRTCISADFELSAISSETQPRKNRAKTASFPQTGSKTRPVGNATTANSVIARYYHFGPASPMTQGKVYICPPTSPTNSSMHDSHLCTQAPSQLSKRTFTDRAGSVSESDSRNEAQGAAGQTGYDQALSDQQIPLPVKDPRICQIKTNAESANDVKVVDMAKYFNYKHGYIIKETQLSNSGSPRTKDTIKDTDIQGQEAPTKAVQLYHVCQDHSITGTPKQDIYSGQSSRTSSPAKSTSKRTDAQRQQMQLPTKPVNAHFCPHHTNNSLQKTMLLAKRAWHLRHSKKYATEKTAKENSTQQKSVQSGSTSNGHHRAHTVPKSDSDCTKTTLHAPVATLHSVKDSEMQRKEEGWAGDRLKVEYVKGGGGRNAMPRRLEWKRNGSGKSWGWTEHRDEEIAGVDGSKGRNTMKKLQELMTRNDVHQKVPIGNIRVKSAKIRTARKPELCSSLPRRTPTSDATRTRLPKSDMHKPCITQQYKGPYILEKSQHKRNHTYPLTNHDRVIDLSQQHMYSLLQEASTKFEDSLKNAEKKKQCDAVKGGKQVDSLEETTAHEYGPQTRDRSIHKEASSVAKETGQETIELQLGQRVQRVKGSLVITSSRPPVQSSNLAPEHVFNVNSSRDLQPTREEPAKSHHHHHNDWDAGYLLERKVSDTIKRAGSVSSKTPDLLLSCT